MSQLKKCVLLFIFLAIGMTSYIVFAKAGQKSLRAEIESPFKWGKGLGPIQVRIEEKDKKNGIVTLEGQVSTKLPFVNIQWKLPEGVTLVSGNLTELVEQNPDETIITRTISVKATPQMKVPHIVFFVYTENEEKQRGNTAIYNMNRSGEETEKLEQIRGMMKARENQPVK
jgi:hypothetical protein